MESGLWIQATIEQHRPAQKGARFRKTAKLPTSLDIKLLLTAFSADGEIPWDANDVRSIG